MTANMMICKPEKKAKKPITGQGQGPILLSCSDKQTDRPVSVQCRTWWQKVETTHASPHDYVTKNQRTNERTEREESGFTWSWVRKGSSIPTQNKTSFITDFRKRLLCFKNQRTLWTSVTAIQSWKEFLLLFCASLWRDKETPSTLAFIFALLFFELSISFCEWTNGRITICQ